MNIVSIDTHVPKISVSQLIEMPGLLVEPDSVTRPLPDAGGEANNWIAVH